jgi:two-component sensor histidine kinase
MKPLLTFLLLLTVELLAAQAIKPELSVIRELETNASSTMELIKSGKGDTSQVNLMIKAAHILYNNPTSGLHELDTAFTLAKTAYTMSRALKFGKGSAEGAFMMSKVKTKQKNPQAAMRYLNLVNGEAKVRLLLVIAEFYTFNFPSNTKKFNAALLLINQARQVSIAVNSFRWLSECQVLLGKFYLKNGEVEKGKKAFMFVIDRYEKSGEFSQAAKAWSRLGNNIPENKYNFHEIKDSHENAIRDYLLAKDKENMAYCLRDLAVLNATYQQTDSAEKQLLRVVSTLRSVNKPVKFETFNTIADFYRYTGKYDRALYYALEARKTPDFNQFKKIINADVLADIYQSMGKKELSLHYLFEAYNYLEPISDRGMYLTVFGIAVLQAEMGKLEAAKALVFLNKFLKKHPVTTTIRKQQFTYAYAEVYEALGDYAKAESHYREMLALDKQAEAEIAKDIENFSVRIAGDNAAYAMGKFYVNRRRFAESRPYLQRSLTGSGYADAQRIRNTYHLLFRVDSAMKNYVQAIKHLQRFNMLNDSINSVARANQFEDLNIKYETVQKEKNIKALENKQKLQEMVIQRSDRIKKLTVIAAIMLLLICLITFVALKNKQRSNRDLTRQRKEINEKNVTLENLLNEKDNFLKEKDWLLKEVHHRVKNNLQIIISLLDTQTVYLENNVALEAIQESQNRVHSIALIHQKLYRSDKPGSISLREYVSDLIDNLSDGFDATSRNILFEQHIESLDIDLSQAVPLGLILNESITNAIKYAFNNYGGTILVEIRLLDSDRVRLSVQDNGVGFPEGFDIDTTNSLGLELMKGLSKQLKGQFNISSDNGVHISVEFDMIKTFENQRLLQ